MAKTGVGRGSVSEYCADYIDLEKSDSIRIWMSDEVLELIRAVTVMHGTSRLKPLFDSLNGKIRYDEIRIAFAFLERGTD